jgi:hypothetical protein
LIEARKLSFQEAWDSSTVFFVDENLENEIDAIVIGLLETAQNLPLPNISEKIPEDLTNFLIQKKNALEVILKEIGLSEEKFMRIVSLLRKLGHIPGGFDSEWSLARIKRGMFQDTNLARFIAEMLVDGKRNQELAQLIPRYYLDTLNYREIKELSPAARQVRYKESLIGTYGARKGHRVESKIGEKLGEIKIKYGVSFERGRSRFIETDIDFAVPSLEDPWVITMSSFQETTSSGQTNKARDMFSAYERLS